MNAPHHAERANGPALERHYQFVLWLIPTLEKMPRAQKFLLGDRLQTQAMQVLEDLISATYTKARRQYLQQANLGLEKMRMLIRLAFDLQHIDIRRYEFAARSLDEVGRLVGGWLRVDTAVQGAA
jgi:23S rRNA-intervening sequence protein